MVTQKSGVIGFAFGHRGQDKLGFIPSMTDKAMIATARRLGFLDHDHHLYLQNEQARCLTDHEVAHSLRLVIKEHETSGLYLDSDSVARQAVKRAAVDNIRVIYVLAMPLLHRFKCVSLVKKEARQFGIEVKIVPIGTWWKWMWLMDQESHQPWTRDPVRLVLYTFRRVVFGKRGK